MTIMILYMPGLSFSCLYNSNPFCYIFLYYVYSDRTPEGAFPGGTYGFSLEYLFGIFTVALK